MNRNTKKGFTIVELIIVIAVIAVLAAVLIPTFSNLIGKAQEAKDTALVRNLNEALAMDTTTSKHLTMSDAVAAVRNNGIDISKIKATVPGNAILWDSVNDLFAYYKVDKEGNSGDKVYYIPEYSADAPADGRLFAVVSDNNAIATSKYGVYYTGVDVPSVTVNGVGFDAGSAQIGTVVYNGSTSGATVDIRTNGGALTINAANDTIKHHNTVLNVNIVAVAQNSYHEFGTVEGTLYVKEGRVSVESTGSVSSLVVTAEKANIGSVKVEATGTIGAIGATDSEVAKDLKNNTNIKAGNADVVETPVTDSENSIFAGGLGTEKSPFLIANYEQFNKIDSEDIENPVYYLLVADITIPADYKTKVNFTGMIDGNNYELKASKKNTTTVLFESAYKATFKNIKLVQSDAALALISYTGRKNTVTNNANAVRYHETIVEFNNVDVCQSEDVKTTILLNEKQSFYCAQVLNGSAKFTSCDVAGNYINASGVKYMGLFVGNFINEKSAEQSKKTVVFEDCSFSGDFFSPIAGVFTGNANGQLKDVDVIVTNFENTGHVSGIYYGTGLFVTNTTGFTDESQIDKTSKPYELNKEYSSMAGSISVIGNNVSDISTSISNSKEVVIQSEKEYTFFISFSVSTSEYAGSVKDSNKQLGSHYFIVSNYIDNSKGTINTGIYKNAVNEIKKQDDVTGFDYKYSNLLCKYDDNGYTVQGYDEKGDILYTSNGAMSPDIAIYVYEKDASGKLLIKGLLRV